MSLKEEWQPDFHQINPDFPSVYFRGDPGFRSPTLYEQAQNKIREEEERVQKEAQKKLDIKSPYNLFRHISVYNPQGGEIKHCVSYIAGKDLWLPQIGERIYDISERYGLLIAERFIENCTEIFTDPRFDFDKYSDLFLKAHRMLGRRVGNYFSLSYGEVIKSDKDPNEFFEHVSSASASGGRLFASYYAYSLPVFWAAGGDPIELRINASKLRHAGGARLARSFMLNAKTAHEDEFPLSDYGDFSAIAVESFGKDIAYWIIRAIPQLRKRGYEPQRFINETASLLGAHGITAAKWFAVGMANFAKAADTLDQDTNKLEGSITKTSDDIQMRKMMKRRSTELEQQGINLSDYIHTFNAVYIQILNSSGKDGAKLYSLLAQKLSDDPFRHHSAHAEFGTLPKIIMGLGATMSKKLLSAAVWHIPKMADGISGAISMLSELEAINRGQGEEKALLTLRYTLKARRSSYFNGSLMLPTFPPGTPWEEIVNYYELQELGIDPYDSDSDQE